MSDSQAPAITGVTRGQASSHYTWCGLVLVVVSHVFTSPFLLLIVIALIVLLNRRDIMAGYVNTWKENTGLGLVALFVAVAAVQGIGEAVTEIF